jgi:hypothetical protein
MIKKILLPHNFGSNTIWLMLSGLFLRIKAKEDLYGRIKLPDDNYLFNLINKVFIFFKK